MLLLHTYHYSSIHLPTNHDDNEPQKIIEFSHQLTIIVGYIPLCHNISLTISYFSQPPKNHPKSLQLSGPHVRRGGPRRPGLPALAALHGSEPVGAGHTARGGGARQVGTSVAARG